MRVPASAPALASMRRALGIALCVGLAGCLTTPLEDRDWVAIETAHHEIWSSLDEDASARVALELERFRAAAAFVWGEELPAAPVRTRVYAFDDRGIGRPFALRSQRSYLLARQRGDAIVLRTGDGWNGDARVPLKLDYARRLFWNASPAALPPWFEEGLVQVASTLDMRGDGATVGALRADHVRTLRTRQWIGFDRLLAASDLSGWSSLERALFEAEAWALCHYLLFSEQRRPRSERDFAQFRALLARGVPPTAAARSAFGDERELQQAVWRHVRAAELDSLSVRIPWVGPRPARRAASHREILEELGWLSLAIDEREQAMRYLELALERGAGSPRATAYSGDALEAQGDSAGADARYEAALAAAPDDPLLHVGWANLLRRRAAQAADPALRAQLVARARDHYQRSLEHGGDLPEPHAGLAASYLLDGADLSAGRRHANAARELLPGDAAIRFVAADLALADGDRDAARREATHLMARARSEPELRAARALLERIGARAAIR